MQATFVAGVGIDLIVYVSGEGPLLLIPDCFLPSAAAKAAYGPLTVCGSIDDGAGGAKLWRRFAADIEEHSFAVVSVAETALVLGHYHPFLEQFRKSAPRREAIYRTFPAAL